MKNLDYRTDEQLKKQTEELPTYPEQLIHSLLPTEPAMDLELLPRIIREYALELSETIGSDPAVSVLAMLSAVCGAADARMELTLMTGYAVPPVMWFMTIGDPSTKKTPASRPVFQILNELEMEDKRKFNARMIKWEAKEAKYNREKKKYIESICNTKDKTKTFKIPKDLPLKPAPLRFIVSDVTSQKLVRHCSLRPEGALCYLDEMTSWISKVTSEKSGEDSSVWLESYSASNYNLDRVGDGEMYCDNFAVSIYGNIQPKVLRGKIKLLSKNGLLQRFIPVVLQNKFNKVGVPIDEGQGKVKEWEAAIRNVYAIKRLKYTLSNEAYENFRDFQKWVNDYKILLAKINDDDVVMTAVGKIEGVVGRLALVFHLVNSPHEGEIPEDTMNRAIEFAKNFIIPSYRHTYGVAVIGNDTEIDLWTVKYIINRAGVKETVSIRDLKRACKAKMHKLEIDRDELKTTLLKEAMIALERHNWVTRVTDSSKTTIWKINSKLGKELTNYKSKTTDKIKGFRESVNKKTRKF